MLIESAFAEVGLFRDFFNRCGGNTLFAKNIQSSFLQLSASPDGSFLSPALPDFIRLDFHGADCLVNSDRLVKRKVDIYKKMVIFVML
jgi:hypothetical protein